MLIHGCAAYFLLSLVAVRDQGRPARVVGGTDILTRMTGNIPSHARMLECKLYYCYKCCGITTRPYSPISDVAIELPLPSVLITE